MCSLESLENLENLENELTAFRKDGLNPCLLC